MEDSTKKEIITDKSCWMIFLHCVTVGLGSLQFGYCFTNMSILPIRQTALAFHMPYSIGVNEGLLSGTLTVGGGIGSLYSSSILGRLTKRYLIDLIKRMSHTRISPDDCWNQLYACARLPLASVRETHSRYLPWAVYFNMSTVYYGAVSKILIEWVWFNPSLYGHHWSSSFEHNNPLCRLRVHVAQPDLGSHFHNSCLVSSHSNRIVLLVLQQ